MLCRGRWRPLLLSFLLTLLLLSFVLSLGWVHLQAKRGNFVDPEGLHLALTSTDSPALLLQVGEKRHSIPLFWLNRAAEWVQRLERWIFPPELRFSIRFGRLLENLRETAHYHQLEEDFYRNAGQV